MIGTKTKNSPVSAYQPSDEVIEVTKMVKKDYQEGVRILERAWIELNDRSVIEDMNRGQMMMNAYVDTSVEDPNEAWKWRGTRSMARNKGIAMHAQITASYLLPLFIAQNENDEEDRSFSEIMRHLIEWMAQPTNSNYQSAFLQVAFGMMSNPVTYMSADFCEVMQKIKSENENGEIVEKEVVDTVLSGFDASVWSANQILITNAYERNIQKQRAIIKRKYVEYEEAEAIFKDHPNWPYIRKGIMSIYSEEEGVFYDIKDDDHPELVALEEWESRRKDWSIPFVNGIYMGDENVNANPIRHRDNHDAPKYNVVPFGFMRIGEHFFYYKSMMNALGWDNMAYDAMSEIVFNRAILENEMPLAITGTDKVDSSVIFPNAIASFEDKDTKITPLLPQSNAIGGFNVLNATKESIEQGSVNDTLSGQLPDASQKAFNVAQAQQNARKNIGHVGKSLAESVVLFGDLMKDIAINHLTVPHVEELTSGRLKMTYKNFLLQDKKVGGKIGESVVKFDQGLIGAKMNEKQRTDKAMELLDGTKYPKENKRIRLVNPELFARFKYLTKVDITEMFTKSDEYWQPILLALKQQLSNDPYVDQEELTRRIMQSVFKSESEELMKEQVQQMPGMPDAAQELMPVGQQPGSQIGQQALNKASAQALEGQLAT